MQTLLENEDLWGCITGTAEYVANARKMTKARMKIILSLEKQNYSHVRSATTPRKTWINLEKAFEDQGLTRKVGLLKMLTSVKLEECKSIEVYINKITENYKKQDS